MDTYTISNCNCWHWPSAASTPADQSTAGSGSDTVLSTTPTVPLFKHAHIVPLALQAMASEGNYEGHRGASSLFMDLPIGTAVNVLKVKDIEVDYGRVRVAKVAAVDPAITSEKGWILAENLNKSADLVE